MIGLAGINLAVVECGLGNVLSVVNVCTRVGAKAAIVRNAYELVAQACERIILPGVGAIKRSLEKLVSTCLATALIKLVLAEHVPLALMAADHMKLRGRSGGALLEIGAGSGIFCAKNSKLGLFERVIGLEPTQGLAQICRDKGIEVLEASFEKAENRCFLGSLDRLQINRTPFWS